MNELEKFGEIYEAKNGKKYIQIKGSSTGISLSRCAPINGTVVSFTKSDSVWWELKLKEYEPIFFVHNNWVVDNEPLREGEIVEGIMDTGTGDSFWYLRRKPKEALLGDE